MQVVNSAGDGKEVGIEGKCCILIVVQQLAVNPFYTVDWMPDSSLDAWLTAQHSTEQN